MSEQSDNMVLAQLRALRRENADMRSILLDLVKHGERLNRSIHEVKRDMHEVKDDLWLMLKAELMGRMGNFETRFEARLDALEAPDGERGS